MKKDERLSVGDRIARARDTYRLSQAQLGVHLAVTRAAVSQYEKDKITPRPRIFDKLAELFNADPEWFESGRGKAPEALDAPVRVTEINVASLTSEVADPRDLSNGREWQLPAAAFAKIETTNYDHLIAMLAPNDAQPISQGDYVLVDTRRHDGDGVFLVVDPASGPQLRRCRGDAEEPRIVGRAITYLHAL